MSAAPQLDPRVIQAWLDVWFRHCTHGQIAVAWVDARSRWSERLFALDDRAIGDFVVSINQAENHNVYFRPATMDAGLPRPKGFCTDEHVAQAPGCWLDLDTPEDNSAANLVPLHSSPQFTITTGTKPHLRQQLYWQTSEPLVNRDIIRSFNQRVLRLYGQHSLGKGGDSKVINPSTLMRMPGTIAWPFKGGRPLPDRIAELTSFRRNESIQSSYPVHGLDAKLPRLDDPLPVETTTGVAKPVAGDKPTVDQLREHLSGSEIGRHEALIRLVAHYVAGRLSDDEIQILTRDFGLVPDHAEQLDDDWTETVATAINSARTKFGVLEEHRLALTEAEVVGAAFANAPPVDDAALARLPPPPAVPVPKSFGFLSLDQFCEHHGKRPEFLIDDLLPRAAMTLVVGMTGAGKSPMLHRWVAHLLLGIPIDGHACRPARVVWVAGESEIQTALNIRSAVKELLAGAGMPVGDDEPLDQTIEDRLLVLASTKPDGTRNAPLYLEHDTDRLIEALSAECGPGGRWEGEQPDFIVFDTLRAVSVGSPMKDEDMALVQQSVGKIRGVFPALGIGVIHHSPKGDPEGALGSNRITAMAENIFVVVPVERESKEDDPAVKRLKWYGPDTEGWEYTTLRLVHLRSKMWHLAKPKRIVMKVREHQMSLFMGPGADVALALALDGHATEAVSEGTGFAADAAPATSALEIARNMSSTHHDSAAIAADMVMYVLHQCPDGMRMRDIIAALRELTPSDDVRRSLGFGAGDSQRVYVSRRLADLARDGRAVLEGSRNAAVWKAVKA